MAAPSEETEEEKSKRRQDNQRTQRKISINDRVEVRSTEDGLLGSWHEGEVVECKGMRLCIRFREVLCDNGSDTVVEWVATSPVIEGIVTQDQGIGYGCYRGNIRPLPPKVDLPNWSLHYGKCVDVLHQDAWWEGVIFDHEDGSDERKVFFPDMGDEMTVRLKDMRATQEWDEVTGQWKFRGDWLLLELIEEVEKEWPLLVSVKQIWYDLRARPGFKNIKEWTSISRQLWKDLLLQVIFNNLELTAKQIFHKLNYAEGFEEERISVLGSSVPAIDGSFRFSEPALEDLLKPEVTFGFGSSLAMAPCEPESLLDKMASSVSPTVRMDADPNCHALDKFGHGSERNSLAASISVPNLDEAGWFSPSALSLSHLPEDHRSVRTKYSKIQWLPAGKDLVPGAEYCPHAITDYINGHNSSFKVKKMLSLNARKHLSFLGWKIEFAKDKERKAIRMRYTSPENVIYLSLIQVCLGLEPESAVISSISEPDRNANVGATNNLALLTGKPHPYLGNLDLMSQSQYVYESMNKVKDLSFEKPGGNLNPETKDSEIGWLPAGQDIVPGADCRPDAITDYINASRSFFRGKKAIALNVRKHLCFLGWKIEFSRYGKQVKLRYISPDNVIYYSLIQICLQIQPESAFVSSISEADKQANAGAVDDLISSSLTEESHPCTGGSELISLHGNIDVECQQSHESGQASSNAKHQLSNSSCTGDSKLITQREYINVEGHYCPQAVTEYVSFEKASQQSHGSRNVGRNAKRHLSATGWRFFLCHKRNRKELRYEAPCGKVFISLRQACIWCVSEGGLADSKVPNGELVQQAEGPIAPAASRPPPLALELEGNLTSCDGFSANQFTDSSPMLSLSKGVAELGAVRTQGIDVLQGKRMWGASHDPCVLLQSESKSNLLRLPEKVKRTENFIQKRDDVNLERRARQVGTPSARQTPSTILSWLIDADVVLPRAKVCYCRKDGTPMKEGRITREGIKCSCCQHVFTLSNFEAHAGSTYHRPSANIFLEDGRSLRECQLQLKRDKNERNTTYSHRAKNNQRSNSNDQICSFCRYGGELVLCDRCPSSFHMGCLGLKEVPDGEWFCPSCCCGICNSSRCNEYAEPSTGDRLLSCAQCERQYHMGCLRSKGLLKHDAFREEDWFCSYGCEQIYVGLQELLGKPIPVGFDNLTWTLLKYTKSEDSDQGGPNNDQLMETYSKLNVALGVMHECFEPVKEPLTRRDLVEDVIFSRWSELNRLNFQGFYTVLLEKDEQLVTVATMRVYGEKVAEIPLVATRFRFRRQGMCRILMNGIEKKLMELGVERMVLPSAPSVLKTWTTAFGFSVMSEFERLNFMSYSFLEFQGTILCHKLIKSSKPCDLGQLKESQQNVGEQISKIDSMDVEGTSAVSEVFQSDGVEEIEIIQRSSGRIVSKVGNGLAPSPAMVHNEIDREYYIDDIENRECKKVINGLVQPHKRRKLSVEA